MKSNTGITYDLEGEYLDGSIGGICSDQAGSVYFEAYYYDNELIFSLMDIDAYNMPDYKSVQYLSFTRSSQVAEEGIAVEQQQQQQLQEQEQL